MIDAELLMLRIKRRHAEKELKAADELRSQRFDAWSKLDRAYKKHLLDLGLCTWCENPKEDKRPSNWICDTCQSKAGPGRAGISDPYETVAGYTRPLWELIMASGKENEYSAEG